VSLSEEEGLHGERLMKEGKSHLNYSHYPHSSFSLVYHWPLSSTWGGAWDFLLFLRLLDLSMLCLFRLTAFVSFQMKQKMITPCSMFHLLA